MPGEKRDLARSLAVADRVVEEEVVELIRPDLLLCALQRAVLSRRHQLGRNLGIEDCAEHLAARLVELLGLDGPADEILDQRLGHARIDAVMAHVIAHAIGAPAQRQL